MPEGFRFVQTSLVFTSQLGHLSMSWASPQPTAIWACAISENAPVLTNHSPETAVTVPSFLIPTFPRNRDPSRKANAPRCSSFVKQTLTGLPVAFANAAA